MHVDQCGPSCSQRVRFCQKGAVSIVTLETCARRGVSPECTDHNSAVKHFPDNVFRTGHATELEQCLDRQSHSANETIVSRKERRTHTKLNANVLRSLDLTQCQHAEMSRQVQACSFRIWALSNCLVAASSSGRHVVEWTYITFVIVVGPLCSLALCFHASNIIISVSTQNSQR